MAYSDTTNDQENLFGLPPWLAQQQPAPNPFFQGIPYALPNSQPPTPQSAQPDPGSSGAQTADPNAPQFKAPEKMARMAMPPAIPDQAEGMPDPIAATGPNLTADVMGGRVAVPAPNDYKPQPHTRKQDILNRIASGLVAFKSPEAGMQMRENFEAEPERQAQRAYEGDLVQYQNALNEGARLAQPPQQTPALATGITENKGDNPAENTAASLRSIAADQAAGRSVYGGPTATAPGAGGTAGHGPVVRAYVNDKNQHVNVFRDGTEQITGTVKDTAAERGQVQQTLERMREAAKGAGGGAVTAEIDLGVAPAGKKEGSTGTLANGHKVIVRNGRLIEQVPGKGGKVTTSSQTMAEMAKTILPEMDRISKEIDSLAASLGPAAGRWNELMVNRGGTDYPQFARLDTDLDLLASAIVRTHFGARGGQQYRSELRKQFGEAQSPEDLKQRIAAAQEWITTYSKMGGQ